MAIHRCTVCVYDMHAKQESMPLRSIGACFMLSHQNESSEYIDIDVRNESASPAQNGPRPCVPQFVALFVRSATLSSALDVDVVINISRKYPSSFCDSRVWYRLSRLEGVVAIQTL
jgi:hypothetical protein